MEENLPLALMILTGSRQEFETQFASTRLRICFGERMRPACRASASSRSRTFIDCAAVNHPLRKACSGATPKPGRRGDRCPRVLFGQLAEPVQRDGSLCVVDFVATVEWADPDPLKSGAFH